MKIGVELLFVIVASFLPGYLFYWRFLQTSDDTADAVLSGAFVCSVFLISTMALISFLAGRPTAAANTGLYTVTVLALLWRHRTPPEVGWPLPLVTFACFSLLTLQLLALLPSYQAAYSLDWSLYYPNTAIYLRTVATDSVTNPVQFEYLVKRPPFFSLFNAFFLSLGGRSYAAYQIVSLFLNSLAFLSVYSLARRFYRPRTTWLCLTLMPITPLLFFGVVIPTPKFVAAFCFLTAALAYLPVRDDLFAERHRRRFWLCVLASATGYMVHPSTILYLLVPAIDQVVVRVRAWRPVPWRPIVEAAAVLAVLIAPWFVWAVHQFGTREVFLPTYTISEQHLTIGEYLSSRLLMLATTAIMPLSLYNALVDRGSLALGDWFAVLQNPLVRFYWETFLGGMTVTATSAGLLVWLRRGHLPADMRRLIGWTGAGALLCLLIHLLIDPEGHAANIMSPLAIVWFVALCGVIGTAARWVRRVVVLGVALEFGAAMTLVTLVTIREDKVFRYLSDEAGPHGAGAIGFALLVTATAGAYLWSVRALVGREADRPL